MDPITIVTTVGGLVANILKIYGTINSKASLYQAAETNAVCTLAICRAVGRALRQIQDTLINQSRLRTDPTVSEDLVSVVGACQITFQLLIDKLTKLVDVAVNEEGQVNKLSKVKMMWNDQEMRELLSNIQGQSSALQLLISAIHLSSNTEILALLHQSNNRALLNRVKNDVSSLRGFRLKDTDEGSVYASSESIDFDFDFQLINSAAYRRAFASAQRAGSNPGLGAASSSTGPTAGNVRPEPVISQTALSEVEVSMQPPQQLISPPLVFVIVVCLIDGTNISVVTNTHETISNLKSRVAAKRGLSTQSLRSILLHNTIELEDRNTLSHYKISTKQTLSLVDVHSKSITLKTFAGRTFYLTYDGRENMAEFKELIHFIEGTPPYQQCLNFKWLGLETEPDSEYWTEYPFKQHDGEYIFLLNYDSLGVEYVVKDPLHNKFHVPIHLHDTVLELKKKVAFLQGTKVELQNLFLSWEKLEDDRVLGFHGMATGRTVRLVPRITQQILIYRDNGPNFPMNVDIQMTVAGLKEDIERSKLIPIEDQFIVHVGIIRPDDYVVCHKGLAPTDPVYLIVRTPLETIISYRGRAEILKCESSDTIDDLKQRIQFSVGVPVDMQTLVYQERVIGPRFQVGTTTLSELGIANGQIINLFSMVVKAKGKELSSEVYCNNTETVRTLRERICRIMSIRISYLRKAGSGGEGRRLRVLVDAKSLYYYSIKDGDTILLRDLQLGVYDGTASIFD